MRSSRTSNIEMHQNVMIIVLKDVKPYSKIPNSIPNSLFACCCFLTSLFNVLL
jgi:hypothetical protein